MVKSILFLILAFAANSLAQDLCPTPASILPCICEELDGRPSLQCYEINDENELERIFSAEFPEPEIQFFSITNSYLSRISTNVFGTVSFSDIYIRTDHLDSVSEDAFENSAETLRNMEIVNCPITELSFPFESLDRYTNLVQFTLRNNLLSEFPPIVSESLRYLYILDNEFITVVPGNAVSAVGNLTNLGIEGCAVTRMEDDAFLGTEQLQYLSLRSNSITAIDPGQFRNLPELLELNLSYNEISAIFPATFSDMPSLKTINFGHNQVETLTYPTFIANLNLENVDFIHNVLDYVEPGTFIGLPRLELIDLGYNNFTRILSNTFDEYRNDSIIYVDNNHINYIEANSFGDLGNSQVNLIQNELGNLYEYWLRPLLEANNDVYLTGNPFTCGCEINWLFEDPSYQSQISGTCPNGTSISHLDPTYYVQNC